MQLLNGLGSEYSHIKMTVNFLLLSAEKTLEQENGTFSADVAIGGSFGRWNKGGFQGRGAGQYGNSCGYSNSGGFNNFSGN